MQQSKIYFNIKPLKKQNRYLLMMKCETEKHSNCRKMGNFKTFKGKLGAGRHLKRDSKPPAKIPQVCVLLARERKRLITHIQ